MLNIYLIAGHGENFRRMPEFLAREEVRITLICCSTSLLRKSAFIDEVVTISEHPHCTNFAESLVNNRDLLSKIDGWVIFASDDDLYKVARSDLELELKLKLLPVRNPELMNIVGSKAEFIRASASNGVPIPKSEIIPDPNYLSQLSLKFSTPFAIKGDQGSSGAGVRIISQEKELHESEIPDTWYPLVIQDFVDGELRGADAFFREGHLLAWIYSGSFKFTSQLGPSISRCYQDPPTLDFEEALKRYGKAVGAHGFANCSMFYLPKENRHVIFEIDLRTNAWHHLGGMFGIDWFKLMHEPIENLISNVQYPKKLPGEGLIFTHWQRHVENAIDSRNWRNVVGLLRIPKSERYPLQYRDLPLERAQLQSLFQLAIVAAAQSLFELLPRKARKALKERGATSRFAAKVASR